MGLNCLCTSITSARVAELYQYQMVKLSLFVLLSTVFIFLVSPKIRFVSGISLINSNFTIVISFLLLVFSERIPFEGDYFDVWSNEAVDLYAFNYALISSDLLLLIYIMFFASIIFVTRCWLKVLFNLKNVRDVQAAFLLCFITILAVHFQYKVIKGANYLESKLDGLSALYVKKYDATEEMTNRYAQENVKSWSANYLRAQFLWDTEREEEALEYYEKALGLLGEEDAEMKNFIEKRIKKIQDERN